MNVLGHWRDAMIRPDRDEPCWTINGHTMRAEGPWLRNEGRIEVVPAEQVRGAVALLIEVRKRSSRPFGGHAPYDLAVRIERFLDDGVYEPHPDAEGSSDGS